MSRRNVVFVLVLVLGVVLDQATKMWIDANVAFASEEIELVPNFLSIVHAHNPGAAFGMMRDSPYRHYVFLTFTVVAAAIILDLFRKLQKSDGFMAATLALILSGAIGNAIDRVRYQYVIDFIRVYTEQPALKAWLIDTFGTNEWPSFNVADSALVVGVLMFLVHQAFFDAEGEPAAETPTEPEQGHAPEGPSAGASAPDGSER